MKCYMYNLYIKQSSENVHSDEVTGYCGLLAFLSKLKCVLCSGILYIGPSSACFLIGYCVKFARILTKIRSGSN